MHDRPPVLILCTALVALGLHMRVSHLAIGGTAAGTLGQMAGYFTILTNLGVVIVMLAEVSGCFASARLAGGLTLAGLVYDLMLAGV